MSHLVKNSFTQHNKPTLLCVAIGMVLFGMPTFANTAEPQVELEGMTITIKPQATRKSNEITGLGKVVKRPNDIDKELVLDIRDLTRYDPGISVVETRTRSNLRLRHAWRGQKPCCHHGGWLKPSPILPRPKN